MSKSLNQAFIKAYSKEERNNAQAEEDVVRGANSSPSASVGEDANIDFLVRFDTATIPTSAALQGPHTNERQATDTQVKRTEMNRSAENPPVENAPEAQPNAAERTVPTNRIDAAANSYQQTNANTAAADITPPAPKLTTTGQAVRLKRTAVVYSEPASPASSDADIRNSIASQMQQAGQWQVASFDTLVQPTTPSLPPSALVHPTPSTSAAPGPASVQTERTHQPELQAPARAPAVAAPASQDAPRVQAVAETSLEAVSPLEAVPSAVPDPQAVSAPPSPDVAPDVVPEVTAKAIEPAAPQAATTKTTNAKSTAKDRYTQVQQSHGQSIPTLSPQPPARAPELAPLEEPAVDQLVRRDEDGEIFRLDRPSYASPPDGTDESAISEAKSSQSLTSVDVATGGDEAESEPDTATPQAVANPPADSTTDSPSLSRNATSEIEQQLREAKQRIFNPVWEVDRLSWPAVCADLLLASGEQMDSVAENLATACEEGLEVMAVTSPQGGEGRTTIACCLAILAASRGMRVALVDADLESPAIAARTNLDIQQDWRTAIEHQLPLEDVAIHSIDDQTTLIPLISGVDSEDISSLDDRIGAMFEELSESFDLVIADMGHMTSPSCLVRPLAETGVVDAVITVINRQQTTANQVETCVERIRKTGIVSIGIVENFMA
ncbi:MAG TPA: hypothetical protein DDW52_29945 [Planctomycetaceae bacterium]|nr:hypothetical protein [Planctomycetaceae bacterium]